MADPVNSKALEGQPRDVNSTTAPALCKFCNEPAAYRYDMSVLPSSFYVCERHAEPYRRFAGTLTRVP